MGSNLVRDSAFDSSFLGAKWPECNPFYDVTTAQSVLFND